MRCACTPVDPDRLVDRKLTERQQRAAESIQENETLTSDLTDNQARTLLDWASYQAALIAGDPSRSDQAVDEAVKTIRRAVRHIASNIAGTGGTNEDEYEVDAEHLLTLAQQELANLNQEQEEQHHEQKAEPHPHTG